MLGNRMHMGSGSNTKAVLNNDIMTQSRMLINGRVGSHTCTKCLKKYKTKLGYDNHRAKGCVATASVMRAARAASPSIVMPLSAQPNARLCRPDDMTTRAPSDLLAHQQLKISARPLKRSYSYANGSGSTFEAHPPQLSRSQSHSRLHVLDQVPRDALYDVVMSLAQNQCTMNNSMDGVYRRRVKTRVTIDAWICENMVAPVSFNSQFQIIEHEDVVDSNSLSHGNVANFMSQSIVNWMMLVNQSIPLIVAKLEKTGGIASQKYAHKMIVSPIITFPTDSTVDISPGRCSPTQGMVTYVYDVPASTTADVPCADDNVEPKWRKMTSDDIQMIAKKVWLHALAQQQHQQKRSRNDGDVLRDSAVFNKLLSMKCSSAAIKTVVKTEIQRQTQIEMPEELR